MNSNQLPPETPRRQLLKRIHRRSSILPTTEISSHLAPSSSTTTARASSRRTCLAPDNASPLLGNAALEKHDEAEEHYEHANEEEDDAYGQRAQSGSYNQDAEVYEHDEHGISGGEDEEGDENGEQAAWAQVDELMDTVQLKNQRILELEKNLSQLQRDLQTERDRSKPSKGANPGAGQEKGLTRAAAIKLEREFLSQEMILKGLQRDNEDKTLEVETLRRKVKIMSDFLARQYGPDDWEAVVSASSGQVVPSTAAEKSAAAASPEKESLSAVARMLSAANAGSPRAANRAKFTPVLGGDANSNPFSPQSSSPSKALNNDDVLIPTIARLQTPASSPSKLFVSSFGNRRTSLDGVERSEDAEEDDQAGAQQQQPSPSALHENKANIGFGLPAGLDPNVLLASIESVKLLMQGFERKNAMRRAELETTIDDAIQAERRAERLQTSASANVHEAIPVSAS